MKKDLKLFSLQKTGKINLLYRSSLQRCSFKKEFLKISTNSRENIWFRPEACNFIKKETPTKVFSCEFCEVFKNIFFTENVPITSSFCNVSHSFICKEVLYICSNLLLSEKSTKTHNFAISSFYKYILYPVVNAFIL